MSPIHSTSLLLWARDDIESVPKTLSSWDNCMQEDYCKWPVIVAIIVGSLIVISIIACIVNCLCCGFSCCAGCCQCCRMCCPSGRRREGRGRSQPKYLDDSSTTSGPAPPPYYQSPPPFSQPYQSPYVPPVFRGPQVAQFDSPARSTAHTPPHEVNEDALPAMPTWNESVTRRVEDTSDPHHDDMELAPLSAGSVPPPPAGSRIGRSGYMEVPTSSGPDGPSPYYGHSDYAYADHPYGPASSPPPASMFSFAPSTAPPTYVSVPDDYPYRPSSPPSRPPTILMTGQGRRPAPNSTRIV